MHRTPVARANEIREGEMHVVDVERAAIGLAPHRRPTT
jgi:hypothetical protein